MHMYTLVVCQTFILSAFTVDCLSHTIAPLIIMRVLCTAQSLNPACFLPAQREASVDVSLANKRWFNP